MGLSKQLGAAANKAVPAQTTGRGSSSGKRALGAAGCQLTDCAGSAVGVRRCSGDCPSSCILED